ncbi:Inherit from bactNOG: Membrane [Seminavis robusta]|uniref:Inherit from bactNOG: Membrane n=1 Tax=Seminavis robusta TaxID=568900 RepID=A0A9N8ETZ4_9STRA|nr:Inherit from bactNOG: Membrane [Seminavis robusta]|eukprot:Sro1565_g282870.1 Inherit from bactNOG: Membrane (287) ;mRNA; r:16834-17694
MTAATSSVSAPTVAVKQKQTEVLRITGAIIFLLSGIYHVDWWRLVQDPIVVPLSMYTEGAKLTVAYLTALLAWRIDPMSCWDETDFKALRIIYSLIAVADTCFIAQQPDAGILVFMIVQGLFIKRHLSGMTSISELTAQSPLVILVFGISAVLCAANATFFWYPRTGGFNDLFIILSIYFCLKCTSLTATYAACLIGKFPLWNAQMTAVGMTMFFICDHTVTGNLLLSQDPTTTDAPFYVVTSSLTWMFYGPALLLLSLSGYHPDILLVLAPNHQIDASSATKKKE